MKNHLRDELNHPRSRDIKRKKFQGIQYSSRPDFWDTRINHNEWLKEKELWFDPHWNNGFSFVTHEKYRCFEFKRNINIATFGKITINIPLYMIALPISIDGAGYEGDFSALVKDYKKRKGFFLVLNIPESEVKSNDSSKVICSSLPVGTTLGTCIFHNHFSDFDGYMKALRSHYRRRIQVALKKSNSLRIGSIQPHEFDEDLYGLYLQVYNQSEYPLEMLPIEFFERMNDEIHVFYEGETKIAFVAFKNNGNNLHFLFGGMEYQKLLTYDLYYSMLIYLIKLGVHRGVSSIDFGQTAESSKCRLGCIIEKKYMCIITGNVLLNWVSQKLIPLLEYRQELTDYSVFKQEG